MEDIGEARLAPSPALRTFTPAAPTTFTPPALTARAPLTTRRELLASGYSSSAVQRERRGGGLTAVRRGIYTPTGLFFGMGLELQHASRARAGALAASSLVVSHISAAVLHGLPVRPGGLSQVHVTRIGRSGGVGDGRRVLHSGRLTAAEITEIDGTRTTSLARTVIDLARTEPFEAAVIAADCALHSHPQIVESLVEILARSRRHRGHTAARLALLFADGRSESVRESRLRVLMHQLGLPPPELQCQVFDELGKLIARTDLGVATCGTLMEFDGMAKYGKLLSPHRSEMEVLRLEKRREERLWAAGWQVLRIVWADLRDPETLATRVRVAFERGVRATGANPVIGSMTPLPPIRMPR